MLSSMTAYGRACLVTSFGRLVMEIQSVNRRHLEMVVSLPQELSQFEMDIRSWVSAIVSRGQVTVRVGAFFESAAPVQVTPNLPLARQLGAVWRDLGAAVGIELSHSDLLSILVQSEGLIRYEPDLNNEEVYRAALKDVVQQALESFMAMRSKEGATLQADIAGRLQLIHEVIERINARAGQATDKYRQRLTTRFQEVVPGAVDNDDRILRELCVYADRLDICEEITRFGSHLKQFEETMSAAKPAAGKTLDFILQELNREINTIGSKASDYEVAQAVVQAKAELERIREQLQNVE